MIKINNVWRYQRHRELRKWGGRRQKVQIFPQIAANSRIMEEIISANKLNSAFKVPQNGGVFSAHFLAFLDQNFPTTKRFSDTQKM